MKSRIARGEAAASSLFLLGLPFTGRATKRRADRRVPKTMAREEELKARPREMVTTTLERMTVENGLIN